MSKIIQHEILHNKETNSYSILNIITREVSQTVYSTAYDMVHIIGLNQVTFNNRKEVLKYVKDNVNALSYIKTKTLGV